MEFSLEIRPYKAEDTELLVKLLEPLNVTYPGADIWLRRKLNQALIEPHVRVSVAWFNGELVGTAIGSLKPDGRYKLSTLYVAPKVQNLRIGSLLLNVVLSEAKHKKLNASSIYLTADSSVRGTVGKFFEKYGFERVASLLSKYKENATEDVYVLLIK